MNATTEHRRPIRTIVELYSLNDCEMQSGFEAGCLGEPCGTHRSRAFWHGWRIGMIHGGHAPPARDLEELGRRAALVAERMNESDGRSAPWTGTMQ